MTGGVWLMLMSDTVTEAEFPAWSVHVPVTDCAFPSSVRTVGGGGLPEARPDSSEHWKLTVTAELFQPFASDTGSGGP